MARALSLRGKEGCTKRLPSRLARATAVPPRAVQGSNAADSNPQARMEGDNHEQADVQVKLAKMSMSGLKKVCNTMNVDHSLSWDKTTLVDIGHIYAKTGP